MCMGEVSVVEDLKALNHLCQNQTILMVSGLVLLSECSRSNLKLCYAAISVTRRCQPQCEPDYRKEQTDVKALANSRCVNAEDEQRLVSICYALMVSMAHQQKQ